MRFTLTPLFTVLLFFSLSITGYKTGFSQSSIADAPEESALKLAQATIPEQSPASVSTVENVGFGVQDGVGIVGIKTSAPIRYEELPREVGRVSIKLKNAFLPEQLQLSRDVKDFASPVNFISSFTDPSDGNSTIIIVELKENAPVAIEQSGNLLNLSFTKAKQEKPASQQVQFSEDENAPVFAFDFRIATTLGAKKIYRGQIVSFDFKDADIRDVLRILADISGFNVIVSGDVKGSVTLKLTNVPWDQAMDVVLENAGLGAVVEGNVIKIAPLTTLQRRQTAIQAAAKSKEQLEPLTTKQVFVNYAQAADLKSLADPLLSPRGETRVDLRTNSILITDTETRVAQISELLKSLDTRTPQILIESRIVQATLDFTRELGVQWGFNYRASAATGNPTGAIFPSNVGVGGVGVGAPGPFGNIGQNFIVDLPAAVGPGSGGALGVVLGSLTGAYDLDIRLSALESRGDGRVLSSPKVLTLDNQEARIEQGVSIPFLSVSAAGTQTQFVDATLRLEVTPQVTNDGRVLMQIQVTDNAPDPSVVGADGQPAIRRNEAETQVLALDGETIVVGGIFTRTSTESLSGIPWLSRIPLLGFLFRNTSTIDQRRELLVFITPRIVR
ncbi:MAG: type IV pilus secretin PilQ [Deltaproteobacteria bacterium]